MADTVALNEVVRVLGTELGKNDERVLIGSTDEEKAVLEKHSTAGKRRAVVGFIAGSGICAGAWKALGGQRRLLGGLTMASGGMAGFMYGILSIRRGLFEDILTLPSDKSPFASRAREILDEQLPNNAFYLEVKQMLKQQGHDTGSWDSVPAFKTSTAEEEKKGFREFERSASSTSTSASRMPRLPSLPQSDDKADNNAGESDTFPSTAKSSSPFFFGGSSESDSSRSRMPSPDYYESRKPPTLKPQDDDPYYNDPWASDDGKQEKTKPVTWEELRRRAASGKQ